MKTLLAAVSMVFDRFARQHLRLSSVSSSPSASACGLIALSGNGPATFFSVWFDDEPAANRNSSVRRPARFPLGTRRSETLVNEIK